MPSHDDNQVPPPKGPLQCDHCGGLVSVSINRSLRSIAVWNPAKEQYETATFSPEAFESLWKWYTEEGHQ